MGASGVREQNVERIEEIYNELCSQLENATESRVWHKESGILDDRAKFHESEEFRATEKLPIYLNERKQNEVYRQINIKKNISKNASEAYRKARDGF